MEQAMPALKVYDQFDSMCSCKMPNIVSSYAASDHNLSYLSAGSLQILMHHMTFSHKHHMTNPCKMGFKQNKICKNSFLLQRWYTYWECPFLCVYFYPPNLSPLENVKVSFTKKLPVILSKYSYALSE